MAPRNSAEEAPRGLREDVLEYLAERPGARVSGEELAERLNVSRNAVWKAVSALREDGYSISAANRAGYALAPGEDPLTRAALRSALGAGFSVEVCERTDSTNLRAKEAARAGAPEGTLIAAREQTGGRGRLGRSFYSPRGGGAYFSLVLRPSFSAEYAGYVTAAAAAAMARALGDEARIKWVNDVYMGGRKVCGILTEAASSVESGGMEYLVLGIGVNVYAPEGGFPPEIAHVAGAALSERVPGARARIIADGARNFMEYYARLTEKPFLDEYRARCFVRDMDVIVARSGRETPAFALGVDDECRLLVRYDDGRVEALASGEISVRPAHGARV